MRSNPVLWLALKAVPEIGDNFCRRLLERFGSPEALSRADPAELMAVDGIGRERTQAIRRGLGSAEALDRAEEEFNRVKSLGGTIVTFGDEGYPAMLREIPDPPLLLYVRGTLEPEDRFAVSVVGSRDASEYGLRMAARIATDLGKKGITVVSGGARGVDAVAHRAALQSGARTIAVLGCGLDIAYPAQNRKLFDAIGRQGALVTEFSLGTPPDRGNFPRRNRVISGLSLGVVVVEASAGSGSLITAAAAMEQGREVFAVPGRVGSPTSRGTHDLIRSGARLTESGSDVLEELGGLLGGMFREAVDDPRSTYDLSAEETIVFEGIGREPAHVDTIAAAAGLTHPEVLRNLLSLELKGIVRQLPGGRFVVQ